MEEELVRTLADMVCRLARNEAYRVTKGCTTEEWRNAKETIIRDTLQRLGHDTTGSGGYPG